MGMGKALLYGIPTSRSSEPCPVHQLLHNPTSAVCLSHKDLFVHSLPPPSHWKGYFANVAAVVAYCSSFRSIRCKFVPKLVFFPSLSSVVCCSAAFPFVHLLVPSLLSPTSFFNIITSVQQLVRLRRFSSLPKFSSSLLSLPRSPMSPSSSSFWWTSAAGAACYHEPKVHDYELYFQLNRISLFVLLPLALLGLLSNTCALICLCTPPKISSGVFIYLKALLVLDHCHIVVSLINTLFPDFCDSHHSREHIAYGFCMFERRFLRAMVPRLALMVDTLHVWTIASLAAHRYWKISRPVVSRFKDTVSRARSLMAILFIAITLYRLPSFLVELQIKWHPVFRIQKRLETTEMLSPYRIWLYSIVDPIVSHFVPFALMCVFSLLTLCEIVKSRHFAYAQFSVACDSHGATLKRRRSSSSTSHPLRRIDVARQRQEYRATLSIVLIILLYLVLHSMEVYILARKWQLLAQDNCPTRADYIQSHISKILSVLSASVNAFVFIAFTNRMRTYIQMLIRRTSRSLSSNSSEPPLHKISETRISVGPVIDI